MFESVAFLIMSAQLWIFSFLLLMVQNPLKIQQETRKTKYLSLAENTLDGSLSFRITPLTDKEKIAIVKRFDDWRLAIFIGLAIAWGVTLIFDITMNGRVQWYCYLITIPEVIFTIILIWRTMKKYQKYIDEMYLLGKLEAQIVHKYKIRIPNAPGYYYKGYIYHVVAAYLDVNGDVHCYNLRHPTPKVVGDSIDCLMYKGRLVTYEIR